MQTWRLQPVRAVTLTLLLLACSHGEPFGPADHAGSDPLQPNIQPLRLTYGGGSSPAWLPDGSGFVYAYPALEHSNGTDTPDLCLGVLPASGGRRLLSACNPSPFESDTLDLYEQPAPASDGEHLAFLRSSLDPLSGSGLSSLVVGAFDSLPGGAVVANNGFPGPHGMVLDVGLLRWLSDNELVVLGSDNGILSPCADCRPVVIRRWRDAYRVAAGGGAAPVAIPGTEFATSIAVGSATELYLTFGNDGRLVHHDLNSGAETVVATFDASMAPRDADYANGRVALVARGDITQLTDDEGQPMQGDDKGGELQVVNVATGAITPLPSATLLFRRPRWSPDGTALLVEGYPYQVVTVVPPDNVNTFIDTVVSATSDIYRVQVP
jgi:hypothetical protein